MLNFVHNPAIRNLSIAVTYKIENLKLEELLYYEENVNYYVVKSYAETDMPWYQTTDQHIMACEMYHKCTLCHVHFDEN